MPYLAAQIVGAAVGVLAAHAIFDLPLFQVSTTVRTGIGQWLAEAIATFGLLLTILGCLARNPSAVPMAVGLYITAAYWFTASTSFANPAVTIARALSDTFVGIAPSGVTVFIAAQIVGAVFAFFVACWVVGYGAKRQLPAGDARGHYWRTVVGVFMSPLALCFGAPGR